MGDNMNRILFSLFAIFLLISPVIYPAISEGVCMEKTAKENDVENTEKLVDHLTVEPCSDPIPIQILNLLLGSAVEFGSVTFYDIVNDEPMTVHVNYSVIWDDNHAVLDRGSFKLKVTGNLSYDIPHGFGIMPSALIPDVYRKTKTAVGSYTIRVEVYVEEDNSSKVVEVSGEMFYYICMLSSGPYLLTGLKVILSHIVGKQAYT